MTGGCSFIGQAGTGKTTQLIKAVEDAVETEPWPRFASILALTYMHGSRRRLEGKLKNIQRRGIQVCCQTIDSFCLNIFQRYKSYLKINCQIVVDEGIDVCYQSEGRLHIGINIIREKVTALLEFEIVQEIMGFSYPIVVIDEFQDCDGQLLDVIKKLSKTGRLFLSADDFQKLDMAEQCEATEWLFQSEVTQLDQIWRTDNINILNSAKALRTNTAVGNGVDVKFAPSKNIAAYLILSNMQWYNRMGDNGRTIAIISPVGPQRDKFIRETLERLYQPMEKKGKYKLMARPFQVEGDKQISAVDILNQCVGWSSLKEVTEESINQWPIDGHAGFGIGVKQARRLMKLRNVKQLSKVEFSGLISSGIHFADTFITRKRESRIFVTVHGAKNREFDDVFILWPKYTLQTNELYLRKLMYNAITRAKREIVVIVQGDESRKSESALNLIM